jgi:hypothetical protein
MKKILVLCLSAALVLSIAAASLAATTTMSGNVRVWYLNTDNNGTKDNTFIFDRLAVDLKADLGNDASLFSEIQGRTINKAASNETHFFVDQAFWTQKNLFATDDALMVGAFDGQVPFKNGYSNVIINGGIGDALKIGNSIGVAYQVNQDYFGFGLAVVNANLGYVKNVSSTDTAEFAWSTRFDFKPVSGLKIGVGYAALKDVTAVTGSSDAQSSQNRMVVDAAYKNLKVTPFSCMVEYGKVDTENESLGLNNDGYYAEIGYTFNKTVAYIGSGSGDLFGPNIKSQQCSSTFKITEDYTVMGLIYTLSDNTYLQGEYAISGSDNSGIGLRLRVNF